MKKILTVLSFLLLAFTMGSCSKPGTDKTKKSAIPPPVENYCMGCGFSSDPNEHCDSQRGCVQDIGENCPEEEINAIAQANSLPYMLNLQTGYDIRDNFLVKTYKGQSYITYYYRLGEYAYDNNLITLSNVGSYYNLAMETITVANILQFGNDSDIPITTGFKQTALPFIVDYRAMASDPDILSYLTNIESDLNHFENKTRLEVLNEIGWVGN